MSRDSLANRKSSFICPITLVDNDRIHLQSGSEEKVFTCFADLLKQSDCSYQELIRSEALIATYMEDHPQATIAAFRAGSELWIISVGMVSEGTHIRSLRVCCHLTRVKTERHFRQVLGRILRMDGIHHGDGYLYVPAEPSLAEYAGRVIEEIPDIGTLRRGLMPSVLIADDSKPLAPSEPPSVEVSTFHLDFNEHTSPSFESQASNPVPQGSLLATYYEANINMFGRFRQELLTLQRLCA